MSDVTKKYKVKGLPTWYWIVAAIALIWNLGGLAAFVMQMMMSAEQLAELPQAEQDFYRNMPAWVNVAFAVSVAGGVLGCVGLLLRKRWALPVLVISLLGVVAQLVYVFLLGDALTVLGSSAAILPAVIGVVAIALIGFGGVASQKGWLD